MLLKEPLDVDHGVYTQPPPYLEHTCKLGVTTVTTRAMGRVSTAWGHNLCPWVWCMHRPRAEILSIWLFKPVCKRFHFCIPLCLRGGLVLIPCSPCLTWLLSAHLPDLSSMYVLQAAFKLFQFPVGLEHEKLRPNGNAACTTCTGEHLGKRMAALGGSMVL